MKPILDGIKFKSKWEEYFVRDVLEPSRLGGVVIAYLYEPMRLSIGERIWYKPDFLSVTKEYFEFIEVKGFMREAARVRLHAAKKCFPWFRFTLATMKQGRWQLTTI
jgi:hypothetical protein